MTVDQELRRAATSLAGVEVAVPPYAWLRRRQRVRRATGLVAGAVVALLAVVAVASLAQGDEGSVRVTSRGPTTAEPATTSSTPGSTGPAAATGPAGSLAGFCAAATEGGGEVPEAYVGTPEHVADVTRYAALAPPEIRDQVETYLAFLAAGGIDPADPDSNLVENFPPPVRAASEDIEAFIAAEC